jgi:hypothetical protein
MRPGISPLDKAARAVYRVHNEDVGLIQPPCAIFAFFGQPAINRDVLPSGFHAALHSRPDRPR